MAQVFRPRANTICRVSLIVILLGVVVGTCVTYGLLRSPYHTEVGLVQEQPVPFSHEHHVAGLGLDCRFCHTSVESSSFAGMPSTQTCMQCHSQVWTNAALLEPVRASWRTGVAIHWTRVHDVPDYAYFNHSIHVNKGVGCSTCHGRVDEMPLMRKNATLFMKWCVDCHRDPASVLRPRSEVFNIAWQPPADQRELGLELIKENHVRTEGLTDCITCHR